jgi:hypothetical protein
MSKPMSEPLPPSEQPFVPTTTRNIQRANHLLAVRQHPGFIEIMTLLQEIVKMAHDNVDTYPGWDKEQMAILVCRSQAAKQLQEMLITRIQEAIAAGIQESRILEEQQFVAKTPAEALEQGDYVRQQVLKKFHELDTGNESRAPGSF